MNVHPNCGWAAAQCAGGWVAGSTVVILIVVVADPAWIWSHRGTGRSGDRSDQALLMKNSPAQLTRSAGRVS